MASSYIYDSDQHYDGETKDLDHVHLCRLVPCGSILYQLDCDEGAARLTVCNHCLSKVIRISAVVGKSHPPSSLQ
jgi:hypothetical protein